MGGETKKSLDTSPASHSLLLVVIVASAAITAGGPFNTDDCMGRFDCITSRQAMTAWAGLTVLPVDKLHQVIKMIETTDHKTLRE
jgi:hypothetical protein